MVNEAAEFTEREFLEVATRNAREIGRSEDPQDILLRYALDYIEDPEETVSTVIWLSRRWNHEYPQAAIEEFLRTNVDEWSLGRIINHLRSRDQFRELEECRQLLQDAAFLRSVRMVPPQRVSAHLLARLLNITPAHLDGIENGAVPVSPEICDSLIEVFGFHDRAAEEFRSRAGIETTTRAQAAQLVIPTETKQTSRGAATAAAPEPEQTLFGTLLFPRMRDNLRDLLATDGPVYMGDGVTALWPTQRELLEQCSGFLYTPVGEQIPGLEGEHIKRGQFMEALSATGSGKTDSFGRLATVMNKGIRAPVLILTPRRLLNVQTKERFCRLHGIDEKDIMIWDSNQPVRERTRLFQQNPPPTYLIASYQSLRTLIIEHRLNFTTPGSRYYRPLVILDEVPEAIGSETGNLIRETFIDKVLVAGFAAADAGAAAALFREQAPIYNLDIAEGIERDVLCQKVETLIIDVPLDDDLESAAMLARMRAVHGDAEYDPLDTSAFARNRRVISAAVDFHLSYYHEETGYVRDRPTVVYIDGINAAAQGARIFNERARALGLTHRAAYVSSEESLFVDYDEDGNVTRMTKNPDEILRMLDSGEIQAVWNDRLMGIGIDIPNLAVCYHVGYSHSLYRLLQEMGRITRKGDGNKTALAFNVCASGTDPYLYEDVLRGSEVESQERQETAESNQDAQSGGEVESGQRWQTDKSDDDVRGDSEVESRDRQQRDERRGSDSRSGGTRRENLPYMQVPNVRVYETRSDWRVGSSSLGAQQGASQLGPSRPEISVKERDVAEAQERSMTEERRRVIRDAEEQLRERVARAAGEDIFNTVTIVGFVKLLPDYTGLSMRELERRLGHRRYLAPIASGQNKGSLSRGIILPFLQQNYPELAPHFDLISGNISLPIEQLMATNNPADFLRILRDAHPLPNRQSFYDATDTPAGTYNSIITGSYVPTELTISRFRSYLGQCTGSEELYNHLVVVRNEEARRRARTAPSVPVSIPTDVLMAARNTPEFLEILRDAHPRGWKSGANTRARFYDSVGLSPASYREAALGDFTPSESAIARFRPYLDLVTGSDDAYQHLLRLRSEAGNAQTRAVAREARRKATLTEPAKAFLAAWDNNKEQIAVDKRSGILMLKLRVANGMSLRETADFLRSREISCDPSKIALWEKGGFPRDNAEVVVEAYVALASTLVEQATEGGPLTGLAGQVREFLTLEAELRRQKRRRNPGTVMGAVIAVPATATATLLAGGSVPPSHAPPLAHIIVLNRERTRSSLNMQWTAEPSEVLSPMEHPEALHDLPKQGKQKDIGAHVEERGLTGLGKKLLGKIRALGKQQRV